MPSASNEKVYTEWTLKDQRFFKSIGITTTPVTRVVGCIWFSNWVLSTLSAWLLFFTDLIQSLVALLVWTNSLFPGYRPAYRSNNPVSLEWREYVLNVKLLVLTLCSEVQITVCQCITWCLNPQWEESILWCSPMWEASPEQAFALGSAVCLQNTQEQVNMLSSQQYLRVLPL